MVEHNRFIIIGPFWGLLKLLPTIWLQLFVWAIMATQLGVMRVLAWGALLKLLFPTAASTESVLCGTLAWHKGLTACGMPAAGITKI
jgi:hypothetical protein